MKSSVHPLVLEKLASVYPADEIDEVATEVLSGLGLASVQTPDDRLRFGRYMINNYTGLKSAVGGAIALQAVLHGANRKVV